MTSAAARGLTPSQRVIYQDVADLYAPEPGSVGADKTAGDYRLPSSPTFRAVRCKYQATENFDVAETYGRQKIANFLTADRFHFTLDYAAVTDGWVICLRTVLADGTRHPLWGWFWMVQGPTRPVFVMRKVECPAVIIPDPAGFI